MRICPEDMLKDVFRPRADRRRAFGCLLPLLIAFHPQANVAWPDDVVIPEAVGGWEIRLEAGVEMNPLVLGGAPRLPSWVPHDIAAGRGAVTESEADGLDRVLLLAFRHGVEQVNGYLPRPIRGGFTLWVFDRIPYAAKTLDAETIVVSGRVIRSPRHRGQLPCLLAHELHHLALARRGFLRTSGAFDEMLLQGLIAEGTATWMCAASGEFPEIVARVTDRQTLVTAFERVREVIRARPDEQALDGLFPQHKFGYEVGAWMISRIRAALRTQRLARYPRREPRRGVPPLSGAVSRYRSCAGTRPRDAPVTAAGWRVAAHSEPPL